jgi:alpha-tubulin suppressor-like RCC1 family protein
MGGVHELSFWGSGRTDNDSGRRLSDVINEQRYRFGEGFRERLSLFRRYTGGVLSCWGPSNNPYGKLTVSEEGVFLEAVAGYAHSCAVRDGHEVLCRGTAANQRLEVPEGVLFNTISAGYAHTCGITTTGNASCWGQNSLKDV